MPAEIARGTGWLPEVIPRLAVSCLSSAAMSDTTVVEPEAQAQAHPLAFRVWLMLAHRSEADARVVFTALVERLRPLEDGRRASAIHATERRAAATGVDRPSAARYKKWRAESPDGLGAPTVAQVRTIFGGKWSLATEALPGVAAPDVLAHRLTSPGNFTRQDCIDALRRWNEQTGQILEVQYIAWSRAQRTADRELRLPATGDPFRRRFDGWEDAMTTAGIAYRRTAGLPPTRFRPQHPRHLTRKEIVDALRTAHAQLGEPFTIARYDAWVRRQAAEYAARQEQSRIPGRRPVTRMFGSWQAAITEALGDRAALLAASGRRTKRYSDDELRTAWWSCRAELGRDPSLNEYEQWRHVRAEATGFTDWPPSEGSIRIRLGDGKWTITRERLLAQGKPDD